MGEDNDIGGNPASQRHRRADPSRGLILFAAVMLLVTRPGDGGSRAGHVGDS